MLSKTNVNRAHFDGSNEAYIHLVVHHLYNIIFGITEVIMSEAKTMGGTCNSKL